MKDTLKSIGQTRTILVGMEATAHYWYGLHDFLRRQGYQVAVLNPIQTAQQAKKNIRKCKTDKVDAIHIATLIKNGDYKAALIPSELAMTCRQLSRLRYRLVEQRARLKQFIWYGRNMKHFFPIPFVLLVKHYFTQHLCLKMFLS